MLLEFRQNKDGKSLKLRLPNGKLSLLAVILIVILKVLFELTR